MPTVKPPRTELLAIHADDRISYSSYKKLEALVNANTTVNSTSTPTQAAYQLGIEQCLRVIREHFLTGGAHGTLS